MFPRYNRVTHRSLSLATLILGGAIGLTALSTPHATAGSPPVMATGGTASVNKWVEYTPEGKMKRPPFSFRKWVYVGTPLTPNDLNDGKANFPEFHNVYMDPDSFAHFEKTGEYRDGTVIVKELVSVGEKEAASGNGYFQGDFIGLEVSVKDAKRYPAEPGNWGYYSFGHSYPLKEQSAKNKTDECNGCHQRHAINFVFSQYYPVLRGAMPAKK
ncbi:MAG: cytochrome P460 family protein [Nitrospira sp.]|nr:cytochrome P460 family protein [Nitrospira sp.]